MGDLEARGLVVSLDDPRADVADVGGKAASLAKLAAAGLPVPEGLCVTTQAYREFVTEGGIGEQIQAAVASVSADGSADGLAASFRTIGGLFRDAEIPLAVGQAIRSAYGALCGHPPVAVRSSATAEDLPELSFAGQQDTFLNVRGADAVLDAVRRCWASLWTARAIEYRARNGIDQARVALAVIVQRIVPAEAPGVLFSADPVSGASDRMVVNAAWGLGESVVAGLATPDTIVLDAATGNVLEQRIGDKAVMTVLAEDGTAERAVPPERRRAAVLDPRQAAELADLGRSVAELYGRPMDIEWAIAGGAVFVLQARPITTGAEPTMAWNDSLGGDYLWSSGNLGEAIPDVMTPCTWSLVQIFLAHAWSGASLPGCRGYGIVGGRFYLNLSVTAALSAVFGISRKRFARLAEPAFGKLPPGLDIPRIDLPRLAVLRRLLPTVMRTLRRTRRNLKLLPAFVASSPERCDELGARIGRETDPARLRDLWITEIGPFFEAASDMLEAGRTSDPIDLGPVLGLGEVLRGELDAAMYSRRYGHRGPHEFEVSAPRPAEEHGWVARQIAALRSAGQDPSALLARQRAAHDAAWERLARDHPRQAKRMRRMIDRWARAARDREDVRSEVIRAFWVAREFVRRAGTLTGAGEDLFLLTIHEILAVLGGDRSPVRNVTTRRSAYERFRALGPYPNLIRGRSDPFRWAADPNRRMDFYDERGGAPPAAESVTGFPGAAGVVQGRARVIADVEDGAELQPGEILVTTVTNVGWTPLFPRVSAVVTDVGAPLSHAAIVARELGIPAVVGCGNATTRLHTGDLVRVDGERGTVEVLAG